MSEALKTFVLLTFFIAVIVVVVYGFTSILTRFGKSNDAPIWCNVNSNDPNEIAFHCPHLSLAFNIPNNSVRIKSEVPGETPLDFTGNASQLHFGKFVQKTVTEYTDTSIRSSSGEIYTIANTGSYQRGTGIYDVKVSWNKDGSELETNIRVSDYERQLLNNIIEMMQSVKVERDKAAATERRRLEEEAHATEEKARKERLAAEEKARVDKQASEEKAKSDALQNVRNQSTQLLKVWEIDPNSTFMTYRYRESDGGYISTMLAADKEGRGGAVLNDGKDTWSGSWKNAQINEQGDTLEIQIDDPAFREKNLKERRFAIKYFDREQRLEWIDRIRILSAQA